MVWHSNLTATSEYVLKLNVNSAEENGSNLISTAPSSTVITTGTSSRIGGSGNYMLYAWKEVAGVSKFGSYVGNGGGGAGAKEITDVGFSPRLIIIKARNAAANWIMADTFRQGPGEITINFKVNEAAAEVTSATQGITPTAAGFTLDSGSTAAAINTNAATYIYAAFA